MSRRGYFLAEAVLAGCLALPGNLAPSEQNSTAAKMDLAPEKFLSNQIGANWVSYNGDYHRETVQFSG